MRAGDAASSERLYQMSQNVKEEKHLERILRGDPGTIKRTPATTNPLGIKVLHARFERRHAQARCCMPCCRLLLC